ncbi:MAG: hypothetical protein NVV62_16785 [Terricaulis sp.]|nr:hypothetical protein [Terricaulis sp.]
MNAIPPLPKASRGGRPGSLEDHDSERLLSMIVALAAEVSMLNDKLDNLTHVAAKGAFTPADVENFVPDAALAAERTRKRNAFVQRVMRLVTADFERASKPAGMDYNDILDLVAGPEGTPHPKVDVS